MNPDRLAASLLALSGVLMHGCATLGEPPRPELEVPANYETPITLNQTDPATPETSWWRGFGDPELDALIGRALTRNLDIGIALANLERSRQLNRAAAAALLPTFDAFVDTELTTVLARGDGQNGSRGTLRLSVGGQLDYDLSLAGRERLALQAAMARFRAAALDLADVRRLTAASVASQYLALRRAQARLVLLDESLQLQRHTLRIVRARRKAGIAPALDVDRVRADLARAESQRGLLEASQRAAGFALAVLVGRPPGELRVADGHSAKVPEFAAGPPLGVPADLLRRRPDVRAAEESLIAAAAQVGVERAELYPSLRLAGTVPLLTAASSGGLDAIIAVLAAVLDLPLLDGGRRRAEMNAQQASADAALLALRRSWLTALQEVENALLQLHALDRQRKQLSLAVDASSSAYRQLDALYREGLSGFIDVLDAQRSLISSREAVVEAEADYASSIVALYTALGGQLTLASAVEPKRAP